MSEEKKDLVKMSTSTKDFLKKMKEMSDEEFRSFSLLVKKEQAARSRKSKKGEGSLESFFEK